MSAGLCALFVAKHFDLFPDNTNKSIINTQTSVCHIWENKCQSAKSVDWEISFMAFVVSCFAP